MFRLTKRSVRPFTMAMCLASALLVAPRHAAADEALRVRPLVRDGQVLVSFSLEGGMTDEMRAVVQSGLRTVFTYTVELKLKAPAWVDRTIATAVVSTTVEYDNLTRRHIVSQTLDGRMEGSRIVEDPSLVQRLVTNFERLPLFKTGQLEANREYYVLVRADARPRSTALWPWSGTTTGSAKFTFIPLK